VLASTVLKYPQTRDTVELLSNFCELFGDPNPRNSLFNHMHIVVEIFSKIPRKGAFEALMRKITRALVSVSRARYTQMTLSRERIKDQAVVAQLTGSMNIAVDLLNILEKVLLICKNTMHIKSVIGKVPSTCFRKAV